MTLTLDEGAKLHRAVGEFCAGKAQELLNRDDPTANGEGLLWLRLSRAEPTWVGLMLEVLLAKEPAAARRILDEVLAGPVPPRLSRAQATTGGADNAAR